MKGYIPILLAIIIGFVFGNLIFDSYETEVVMNSDGNVYMLQYGAYTNEEVMKENIKKLDSESYIVDVIDNIYYVYFGITTNYYNALNIVKIYKEKDIFLYIKDNYLGKSNMISQIKKIDNLIKDEKNQEKINSYLKEGLLIYKNSY